jgi:hypothetical protein
MDNIDLKEEETNEKEHNNIIEENNIVEKNEIQANNEEEKDNIINQNEKNENDNKININIDLCIDNNDNNQHNNNIDSDSSKKEDKEISKEKEEKKSKSIIPAPERLQNIPVYINSAKLLEINNDTVFVYFLRGKLVNKEIIRTYIDFELYHQALSKMWPCISVPLLYFESSDPSIKLIETYPEIKTKLLNHFCKKLNESKEFLNCEITKIFLSQEKGYDTKIAAFININSSCKEISERYFKTFTYYTEDLKITNEKEAFVKKFIKLLEVTLRRLNEIGKTLENEIANIKKEQKSLDFVTEMFIDLEKSMPNKKRYLTDMNNTMKPLKSVSNISIIMIININFIFYYILLL